MEDDQNCALYMKIANKTLCKAAFKFCFAMCVSYAKISV